MKYLLCQDACAIGSTPLGFERLSSSVSEAVLESEELFISGSCSQSESSSPSSKSESISSRRFNMASGSSLRFSKLIIYFDPVS